LAAEEGNGESISHAEEDAGLERVKLPGDDEEKEWYLEPFQRGEPGTFIRHIEAGVREHRRCLDGGVGSVLVFCGGAIKTGLMHGGVRVAEEVGGRGGTGNRTEGAGYLVSSYFLL
jgi:hypothetical protein